MINEERLLQCFPFDTYRKYQKEVLVQCINAFNSGKKHVVINAPVGFGKSAIALSLSRYFGSSYIGTTQKSLQKQYCTDFNLPELYGKSNYSCIKDVGLTCDNPTCKKEKCQNCPYLMAREDCLNSDVSIMNYSLLFSLKMYSPLIEKRSIVILDEAHNVEDQLTDFIGINISNKTFNRHNISLIPFPANTSSTIEIVKWLIEKLLPHLNNTLNTVAIALEGYLDEPIKMEYSKQYALLDKFVCQINRMIKFINEDGLICAQVDDDSVNIKPLLVNDFAKPFIESIADKCVHISATMPSKTLYAKCMGIPINELEYISVGSVFPPENRPIYFVPVGKMTYGEKAKTLPAMMGVIDKIMNSNKHTSQRGIIHTSTYDIATYIYENSKNKSRLVFPKSHNKAELLEKFYNSERDDLVLISPSLMEGVDLKGDLAEFSIICKLPFASLGDKWVKEKMNAIDEWYTECTINKLVQSTGRHIRSETEKGITYILDETFGWFYNQNKYKFPKWWTESLHLKR